jgi:hypothetical protein
LLEALTAVALLGGAALGWRGLRALDTLGRVGVALLFALALALRLAAPAGPHDVNFRAWGAYSEGALDVERGYGMPAFARLLHPLVPGWQRHDAWLFHANAVVASFAPIALLAWLRTIGLAPVGAWTAACLLAVATPLVRFGHTDAQQIPALTLGLIGLATAATHARRPSWAAAMVAGAALAASACGRLEGAALPLFVALLLLADRPRVPWRHPATWTAAVGAVAVALWNLHALTSNNPVWEVSTYQRQLLHMLRSHSAWVVGWRHWIVLDPAYTAPPVAALMAIGLTVGALPARARVACAAAVVGLTLIVPSWTPAGAASWAIARYQIAALPFSVALVGAAVARAAEGVGSVGAKAALAAAVVAAGASRLQLDLTPTTQSAEYAFVRDTLPTLPQGCVLLHDVWTEDLGLVFPGHLVTMGELPLELRATDSWTPDPGRCTLYYRAATCSSHNLSHPTGAADPRLCVGPGTALAPLVEAQLPARQWVYDRYDGDAVKVGFYRVQTGPRPVDAPLPPRADGAPALVVWVALDGLPPSALDSLAPNYNGGLVRLTSPDAARAWAGSDAQTWLVDLAAAGGWRVRSLAVDQDGLSRLRLDEAGAWTDPTALQFSTGPAADPTWREELDRAAPLAAFANRPWIATKPGVYAAHVRDDQPGEHGPGGVGDVFPHPAPTGLTLDGAPVDTPLALRSSPAVGEALTSAALATVRDAQLGRSDSTDLLVLSYDQVGHIVDGFSPASWETLDALLRLDLTLATLFDHLDRAVGAARWSVVLSSSADADGHALWLMWGAGVRAGHGANTRGAPATPENLGKALGLPPP